MVTDVTEDEENDDFKKLQALQVKLEELSLKCSKLETEKEDWRFRCHQREQDLISLQDRIEKLNVENPIQFADSRIRTTLMKRGNILRALKDAYKIIDDREIHNFYVGATSNPDDRMRRHSKNGYATMHILYCTPSYYEAEDFETKLLSKVYYESGCLNQKNGSCGLVKTKQMFYVYVLQ